MFPQEMQDWIFDEKLDTLIIGGGGVRGIAFCGALQALEELLSLKNQGISKFKHVIGTSVGSLIGLFLTLGYSVSWLKKEFLSDRWTEIYQGFSLFEFNTNWSVVSNERMVKYLKECLLGTGNSEITFKELFEQTQVSFTVTTTSLENMAVCYHNHSVTPTGVVWKAIIASAAIPFLFPPVKIDSQLHVDGGVLEIFSANVVRPIGNSIVLFLEESEKHDIQGLKDYCFAVFCTTLRHTVDTCFSRLPEEERFRVIQIKVTDVKAWDFDISESKRAFLFDEGHKAMMSSIDTRTALENAVSKIAMVVLKGRLGDRKN